MRSLDYDARQFYSLLPAFLDKEQQLNTDLSNDPIIQQWLEHLKSIPIPYLVTLSHENDECNEDQDTNIGYDVITNLCGEGYFVASLSTVREEICVWDVPK